TPLNAEFFKHTLEFITPAGTSRGVMTHKESWFIVLRDGQDIGIGECGLLKGLSFDDRENYEEMVRWVCENIGLGPKQLDAALIDWPSIRFGVEAAFISLASDDPM